MAVATGFGAAFMVHCEMYGLTGYKVTVITDSHYVTTESMQAFKPVLSKLGLPDAVEGILRLPTFR